MDSLPSVIVYKEIFSFLNVSDFFNTSLVCRSFHIEISELMKDTHHKKKLLIQYHKQKIKWFGNKLSLIPNTYLYNIKSFHIYLLLQDIYTGTNHINNLGIHIPYRTEMEDYILRRNEKKTFEHGYKKNSIMKHIREELTLITNDALSMIKKIKNPPYNKKR